MDVFTGVKLDLMKHFCILISIRALEQKPIHQIRGKMKQKKMSKNLDLGKNNNREMDGIAFSLYVGGVCKTYC